MKHTVNLSDESIEKLSKSLKKVFDKEDKSEEIIKEIKNKTPLKEKTYRVKRVAEIAGLDPRTVTRHIREEILPAFKLTKHWLVKESDLKNYLNGTI